jgi:hypothetical protein
MVLASLTMERELTVHIVSDSDPLLDAMVNEAGSINNGNNSHWAGVDVGSTMDMVEAT